MSRSQLWPWVRPFLVMVMVVSLPPLVYWFGYVQSSVQAQKARGHATLSAVATEFRDRLGAHDRIAANARKLAEQQAKQQAEQKSEQQPEQDAAQQSPRPVPSRIPPYLKSVLKAKEISSSPNPAKHNLEIDSNGGGLRVNAGKVFDRKFCKDQPDCFASALVPLENLIAWNVVETEFDGLLVLDGDGRLVAQDRRLPAQPLGIRVPLVERGESADLTARLGVLQVTSAGDKPAQKPIAAADSRAFRGPFDFRDDTSVQLAGVDYLAILQPVSIAVSPVDKAGEKKTETLFVCGLLAKHRVRQSAVALAPQTLIGAGVLVAFGLFAIPFLKLRFIGERERMRQRDMWLLAISVLSATALMVLVVLDFSAVRALQERFDAGLEEFSASMVTNLTEETADAVAELEASAPALLKGVLFPDAKNVAIRRCNGKPSDDVPTAGSVLASARTFSYAAFEAIFITDLCGSQISKWMVRTDPTPNINLLEQPYFSAVSTATPQSVATPAQKFKFTTSVAPTTGLLNGLYTMPVGSSPDELGTSVAAERRVGLAMLVTPLASVNSSVVAEPFQFVLVDRRGEVAFQQTGTSFRGERFFDTVLEGLSLERAVRTQVKLEPKTYAYRGRLYRMTATDIPELELTLIAYYDKSVVGALATRVFSTATLFVVGILVSMLIGAALSTILYRGSALEWAWPTISRTGHYVIGSVICVVSMVLLIAARSILGSTALAAFMFLAPALIMVVLGSGHFTAAVGWLVRKIRWRAGDEPTSHQSMRLAFHTFVIMALLAFVAWPTVIAFDDAFRLHSAAYASDVSRHWRAAERKWHDRNLEAVVNVGAPMSTLDCTRNPDVRCTAPSLTYASANNYERLMEARRSRGLYPQCTELNESASSQEEAAAQTAAPMNLKRKTLAPSRRTHAAEHRCRISMRDEATQSSAPYSMTARLAGVLASVDASTVELANTLSSFANAQDGKHPESVLHLFSRSAYAYSVLGALLLICAVTLLVRSVGRHVLGIDFIHEGVLDTSQQFRPSDATSWLLLRPSRATLARLAGDIAVHDPYDTQCAAIAAPPAGKILHVPSVESRLSDPAWRNALLDLLRKQPAGCIVMVSDIDPLHYLTQKVREKCDYLLSLAPGDEKKRAEAEETCGKLRDELSNWAMALRDVRKIRDTSPRLLSVAREPGDAAMYDRLARECESFEPLSKIGTRLLETVDLRAYRWDQIVDFVRDGAEPYYRTIWGLSSREERLVLIQLAQDGLINPKRHEIVRRLARRGLIILDPHYRLMNESFAKFVAQAEPPERIADWERTSAGMSWARLGTPLYAFAAIIIAILLFTEQALFTNVLAIASGAVGTIGSLRGIYASAAKPLASDVKLA